MIINKPVFDKAGQVSPHINLGIAYFYQGDWTEASRIFNKGLGIAQEIGNVDSQNSVSLNLANIHTGQGDWSRAASMYRQWCVVRRLKVQ